MGTLEDLQSKIKNKAKGTHVSTLSESQIATGNKDWIQTPAYDLNRILSGSLYKGIPSRSFSVIVGPEHSFKSSFMCLCLAEAQRQGYTPVILDTEGGWTKDFVERWSLDPNNALYIYTPWVENLQVSLAQILTSQYNNLAIALDSIGGLDKYKLINDAEAGDPKQDQGGLARDIKKALKILVNIVKSYDSIAIAGGHFYGNPNSYGGAEDIGGGKSVKLFPDVIVSLKNAKILDTNKNVVGSEVTAITRKNRFFPPFNEAKLRINYVDGINQYAGLPEVALKAGFIEQRGSWVINTETGQKVQGLNNFQSLMTDELLEKIDDYIKNSGYSTYNPNVAEAEKLAEKQQEEGSTQPIPEEDASVETNEVLSDINTEEEVDLENSTLAETAPSSSKTNKNKNS